MKHIWKYFVLFQLFFSLKFWQSKKLKEKRLKSKRERSVAQTLGYPPNLYTLERETPSSLRGLWPPKALIFHNTNLSPFHSILHYSEYNQVKP